MHKYKLAKGVLAVVDQRCHFLNIDPPARDFMTISFYINSVHEMHPSEIIELHIYKNVQYGDINWYFTKSGLDKLNPEIIELSEIYDNGWYTNLYRELPEAFGTKVSNLYSPTFKPYATMLYDNGMVNILEGIDDFSKILNISFDSYYIQYVGNGQIYLNYWGGIPTVLTGTATIYYMDNSNVNVPYSITIRSDIYSSSYWLNSSNNSDFIIEPIYIEPQFELSILDMNPNWIFNPNTWEITIPASEQTPGQYSLTTNIKLPNGNIAQRLFSVSIA